MLGVWDVYGISVGEFQELIRNRGLEDVKNLGLICIQMVLEHILMIEINQGQCIE